MLECINKANNLIKPYIPHTSRRTVLKVHVVIETIINICAEVGPEIFGPAIPGGQVVVVVGRVYERKGLKRARA